ncbi:hypothetical protein AUJ78_01945 [Candidatus Peregrinibacteria bacterium CG1_02_41_10]|nr:MAG: hypothetical protein AUJ78_01945 [Candidatus Peregrinibacteria bacterium CG1_02_41_10]
MKIVFWKITLILISISLSWYFIPISVALAEDEDREACLKQEILDYVACLRGDKPKCENQVTVDGFETEIKTLIENKPNAPANELNQEGIRTLRLHRNKLLEGCLENFYQVCKTDSQSISFQNYQYLLKLCHTSTDVELKKWLNILQRAVIGKKANQVYNYFTDRYRLLNEKIANLVDRVVKIQLEIMKFTGKVDSLRKSNK